MALAIQFDRGMDPVVAFDLLRTRRPQAYAIYATQYLRLQGRRVDAKVLDTFMEIECNHDDLVATIGRIRDAESDGSYRFHLQPCADRAEPGPELEEATTCRCHDANPDPIRELADLMCEYKGFPSTEWPLDWVRSLIRQLAWERENRAGASPFAGTEHLDLSRELDEWLEDL